MSRREGESVGESLTCKSSTRCVSLTIKCPDWEPAVQEFLLKKNEVEIDNIYAKRQRTQGWFAEE